ncbi:hypothetical protein [Kamptonema sp. UHCC 0994]|uniref:hypothetical protein n=1 Tax=Kamptonema sp. UHCC 0994 TaxID=3031329 RepID=UPI0023B8C8A6|nr:hypothetical protein [Kamptonema sp. UHCC 0994]MDF0554493.1 hypothetical protein [Kamptonema sp. UHCC 0994]
MNFIFTPCVQNRNRSIVLSQKQKFSQQRSHFSYAQTVSSVAKDCIHTTTKKIAYHKPDIMSSKKTAVAHC